ncbi:MAG: nuclear transport factor 2 family protein [Candidatus Helarchaeota archaeon]
MTNEETEIKNFVDNYIKVLQTGKVKFVEENVDIKAMYEKDGEIYGKFGLSKKMSLKEYEKSFLKNTLYYMKKGWDKKFEFESFEIKDDGAIVKVKAEGAKRQDQPLILKKIDGKWKLIWIPTWAF